MWDYQSKSYVEEKDIKDVDSEVKEWLDEAGDNRQARRSALCNIDAFGYFTNEYGNGSISDLVDEADKIFASDEMVLTFIFSNSGGFSTGTYYDG